MIEPRAVNPYDYMAAVQNASLFAARESELEILNEELACISCHHEPRTIQTHREESKTDPKGNPFGYRTSTPSVATVLSITLLGKLDWICYS